MPHWKIALYLRLSKDDGKENESESISNQKKILTDYVKTNITESYIISDIYIDDGLTGTDVNRPGFIRMEKDIIDGKINCVIVKSLARAFRNLGDQQKYLEEFFPLYQIRFINIGTPFIDTYKNPQKSFSMEIPIYGMFNEQFAAATSEEVRKTFDAKRKKGEFIGAFAPYGYQKDPNNKNKIIVDPKAAKIVKEIYHMYFYENLSINGIALKLNSLGIPSPSKYKTQSGLKYSNPHSIYKDCRWSASTISHILKNKVYTGCMVQGRHRIINYKIHKQIAVPQNQWYNTENTHEPIISTEIFNEVQKKIKTYRRTAPRSKQNYLYSGLLYCGNCNKPLHRKKSGNHIYYYCRTKQTQNSLCTIKSIRLDKLDKCINQSFLSVTYNIPSFEKILQTVSLIQNLSFNTSFLNQNTTHFKKQISAYEILLEKLYIDWKNNEITKEEYTNMKSSFHKKIEELNSIIDNITWENEYRQSEINFSEQKVLPLKLIASLIDTVTICDHNKILIKFKFCQP